MAQKNIPTYASDGRRLPPHTLKAVLDGLGRNILVVQRNHRGKIICAHFRTAQAGKPLRMSEGSHPLRKSAHIGTRYSFERSRKGAHQSWDFRPLVELEPVERITRAPNEDPASKLATVIPIDRFRPKRTPQLWRQDAADAKKAA